MIECAGLLLNINPGLLYHTFYLLFIAGTSETLDKNIVAVSFLEDMYAYCTRFILAPVDKHTAILLCVTQITKF